MAAIVNDVVSISLVESLKIHCLSFLWGLWILAKVVARTLFKSGGDPASPDRRRKPPESLTDCFGQHHYVKLKDTKLHYVEVGGRDRSTVLLLHGFPDCWISWRHQLKALSEDFRVISLDLKGFGESDKPGSRRSYRVDVLVSELQELIGTLAPNGCAVVGHDLGALLGWYLVHLSPKLVRKFVAISCPHPNFYWTHLPDSYWFNTNWVHYSQLPHLPETDALRNDLNIINQCFQHLNIKNLKEEAYLDAYKYYFSRKEDWTGAINYYRELPFRRLSVGSGASGGAPVRIPCLLVIGSGDAAERLESVVRSTEYLADYRLKIIDGATHFPHQQRPHVVNSLLLDFLVDKPTSIDQTKSPSSGLFNRMVGAVSTTVRFASSVSPKVISQSPLVSRLHTRLAEFEAAS